LLDVGGGEDEWMIVDEDDEAALVAAWEKASEGVGLAFSLLFSCDEVAVSEESAPSARSEDGSCVRKRGDAGRGGGRGGGM
jgi:hypothetical protein